MCVWVCLRMHTQRCFNFSLTVPISLSHVQQEVQVIWWEEKKVSLQATSDWTKSKRAQVGFFFFKCCLLRWMQGSWQLTWNRAFLEKKMAVRWILLCACVLVDLLQTCMRMPSRSWYWPVYRCPWWGSPAVTCTTVLWGPQSHPMLFAPAHTKDFVPTASDAWHSPQQSYFEQNSQKFAFLPFAVNFKFHMPVILQIFFLYF